MKRLNLPQRIGGIAMIVVAISAFLPWVSIFGISVSGIRGDGAITLICALIGLAALAVRMTGRARKSTLIVSGIAAAITALVGLVDMNDFAAIGLYLTLLAGIAWVAAVIWDARTPHLAAS